MSLIFLFSFITLDKAHGPPQALPTLNKNIHCKSQRKKERKKETTLGGTSTHAGTMVKITKFI